MSFKSKASEAFYTVGFMFAITFVCVAGVAGIYRTAKPRITLNRSAVFKKAVLSALDIQAPSADPALLAGIFNEKVKKESENTYCFEDKTAFKVYGKGLWGKIEAVVGFKSDGGSLSGVYFIKNSETPGLGARIDEKWFMEQFRDKKPPLFYVSEGAGGGLNSFDAITGATITTEGVKNMINDAYAKFQKKGGGK
jgi:Na+-transporting NADH:ubiquinone oxidoreductase subunit C